MYQSLIKQYIDKLNINQVNDFLIKNEIYLTNEELNYVFYEIKTDYPLLFQKNYETALTKLKANLSTTNYQKIYQLYLYYRKRYENYL